MRQHYCGLFAQSDKKSDGAICTNDLISDSLKHKKIILNKINDLEIYYVTDKKIIYYNGLYNDEIVKGEIYII